MAKNRKWGDRRDGRWVKDVPGLQTVMAYILPKRTDCEVYLSDQIDVTELVKYIDKKNAEHPDYRTTIFHSVVFAVGKMIHERPKMNRFIQGFRMYERDEISLSFVCKRRFRDNADEALMVFVPTEEDTLTTLSRKIAGDVKETRKSESSTGGIDSVIDWFASLPRFILIPAFRIIRWLDFWGKNPKILTDGDPNYTTVLLSNLGSIRCPSVYHHLNNYGTNSIMITHEGAAGHPAGGSDSRRADRGRLLFCEKPEAPEAHRGESGDPGYASGRKQRLRLQVKKRRKKEACRRPPFSCFQFNEGEIAVSGSSTI